MARFCLACAAPLTEVLSVREERKVVTVLFADLVGFTARRGAAGSRGRRARFSRRIRSSVRSELERHGGTVEKFIGDAVMALFGAPVAHEDDPERAVRAALAIRDWARGGGARVRIAVNTGEALVRLGAQSRRGRGDGVGRRRQHRGAAAGSRAGERDPRRRDDVPRDAARDRVPRASEPVEAKGRRSRFRSGRRSRRGPRFGVDVRQLGATPLVGREHELDAARRQRSRACGEERSPQLVTLVGVPGIGKSRLVYELFADRRRRAGADHVASGAVAPVRRGRELLGARRDGEGAGGHPRDRLGRARPSEARAKRRGARRRTTARRAWIEAHLRPLVGLERGRGVGGEPAREAFAAWRRFFEALAEQRPLVLVFEDLHWADDGLLDFVDHLVDWARGVPLLVVGTARPELLERRPGWGGGKPNALTLSLSPLSDEETAALRRGAARGPLLAAETQQELLERAGGNPLYAEEFVRMLARARRRRRSCRCRRRSRESSPRGSTRSRPRRRRCSRTRPWSARCSGLGALRAMRERTPVDEERLARASSARSSSAVSAGRRSPARTSTRSGSAGPRRRLRADSAR